MLDVAHRPPRREFTEFRLQGPQDRIERVVQKRVRFRVAVEETPSVRFTICRQPLLYVHQSVDRLGQRGLSANDAARRARSRIIFVISARADLYSREIDGGPFDRQCGIKWRAAENTTAARARSSARAAQGVTLVASTAR